MAVPPLRATTFWLDNTVTVDTGTGIDVRSLDDEVGTVDSTQTASATHNQDNGIRTFDPGTAVGGTASDPLAVLQKKGWALPLADITPADTRCRARLPAGDATLRSEIGITRSGDAPLADTTNVTMRASLWKYNPTTDTGTFIASGTGTGTTYELFANTTVTKAHALQMIWAADVIFERDEILYVQVGVGTGTLGNPLGGTTTYTFRLFVDGAGRDMTLNVASLNATCDQSAAAAAALNAAADTVITSRRTFTGAVALGGAFDRQLTSHRTQSATLTLGGIFDRTLTLHRTFIAQVTLNAQRAIRNVKLTAKQAALTLNAAEDHSLVLRRQRAASLHLNAAVSVAIRKTLTANLSLNAAIDTLLRLRRQLTAGLTLNARATFGIAQHILARLGGGAVIVIRKIFSISD